VPLAVSDLGLCVISASKPISVVQLLKLCDLGAEKSNLFPKHCEMIHTIRIASEKSVGRLRDCYWVLFLLRSPHFGFGSAKVAGLGGCRPCLEFGNRQVIGSSPIIGSIQSLAGVPIPHRVTLAVAEHQRVCAFHELSCQDHFRCFLLYL